MRGIVLGLLLLATLGGAGRAAAQDADGCKDHPLFNRIRGYVVAACESYEFDAGRFPVGAPLPEGDPPFRMETVEGRKSELTYAVAEGGKAASALQILRNFQNAVKAAGGEVRGEYEHVVTDLSSLGGGDRATTLVLGRNGAEAWALLLAWGDGYRLQIIEREAMAQDIVAHPLIEALERDGKVEVPVLFDTGKASIKAESAALLDDIARALTAAPALNVEVAGHTDSTGTADGNLALSEARARSVVAALVTRGIAAARLQPRGYGQTRPVADNATEAGRARNRRVELVKQ